MVSGPRSLAGLPFSVAGPGRVGGSLAAWLVASGARLVAVAGRSPEGRARQLARRWGGEAVPLDELAGRGEELLLVAVADQALDGVAHRLARHPPPVALHTAGARGAEALAPMAAAGAAVGSLHPLKAFPGVLDDPAEAAGVVFGVDGDPRARELAERLAAGWGAETVEVAPEARRLYHLAATLSAGGVVTLLAAACRLAREQGLPAGVCRGYLELARGAVAAATRAGEPVAALTGPVARGDAESVEAALGELGRKAPESLPLARWLCRETLRQLALSQPLDPAQQALFDALESGKIT